MTCSKGWVGLKLTASTSRASHAQIIFLLLNSCCLADGVHFFHHFFLPAVYAYHCLMYNDMWQSAMIALLHIEHTILVFQCCTLLHPFPHINLFQALSLLLCSYLPRLWLICLYSHVIKSCQSPCLPTDNSSHLIIFQKVVWSLSLDYSIPYSTSYAPHVPSSFKSVLSPGIGI